MKRLFLVPVLILLLTVCLEPERDNPYDPLNPDKAYLGGTTYRCDGSVLPGVVVKLMQKDSIIYEVTSNGEGWYEFERVDPGIYDAFAHGDYYYKPHTFDSLRLPAGEHIDTADIHFNEMLFDFESENVGTRDIPEWTVATGWWIVGDDLSSPSFHTIPHVFRGQITDTLMPRAHCLTDQEFSNFFYHVSMKSEEANPPGWQMGVIFRYTDPNNYYRLRISSAPVHVAISKRVDGIDTPLSTYNIPIGTDIWYRMVVECVGNSIFYMIQGQGVDTSEVILDSDLTHGRLGIITINPGEIHFDDIWIGTK